MRRYLFTLLILLVAGLGTAFAQSERQDFASRFMTLYAKDYHLDCTTVSPLMMEKMLKLPDVEDDATARQVLSQLKSIRMIMHSSEHDAPHLYANAQLLAQQNAQRYKPQAEETNKSLYLRKRGKVIVELVLFMQSGSDFILIDLTGNMTEAFLQQIQQL